MKNALHFVGFRGDEYITAVRLFGLPDFYHYNYDARAVAEFMDGDTVVFANGFENKYFPIAYNDSDVF